MLLYLHTDSVGEMNTVCSRLTFQWESVPMVPTAYHAVALQQSTAAFGLVVGCPLQRPPAAQTAPTTPVAASPTAQTALHHTPTLHRGFYKIQQECLAETPEPAVDDPELRSSEPVSTAR